LQPTGAAGLKLVAIREWLTNAVGLPPQFAAMLEVVNFS
jgi:hypothetical protein